MEKELYSAASNGDVATLKELLREGTSTSSYLLETVSFACSRSLLHVATTRGQLHIVDAIVTNYPELARNLDSQNSSPLHMAAAQGHFEIARALLSVAPEVCWWRDWGGMNPIHLAAMNGHVEILELLIGSNRFAAAERLDRGQTVLHLCVKHRQLAAFEFLKENLGELVSLEDDNGETAMHLAVRLKQVEAKTMVQIYRESFPDATPSEIIKIPELEKKGPSPTEDKYSLIARENDRHNNGGGGLDSDNGLPGGRQPSRRRLAGRLVPSPQSGGGRDGVQPP